MPTILIADDEPLTLRGIRDGIPWEELGIETVLTAKNGIEALEAIKGRVPDIVLTDVYMPRMDGINLAKKIRDQYPQCAILFLTGYTKETYLRSAIELKAERYINKPINMEELYEIIDTIIENIQEKAKAKHQIELSYHATIGMMLSRNSVSRRELLEALYAANLDTLFGKPFCCVNFLIPNSDDNPGNGDVDFQQIQMGVVNTFTNHGLIPLSYIDSENKIICFTFFKNSYPDNESVKGIINGYKEKLPESCVIAVSEITRSLEEARRIFLEASERLDGSFYLGNSIIMEKSLPVPDSYQSIGRLNDEIKESIMSGQYEKTGFLLKKLQDSLNKAMPPISYAKNILQELFCLIRDQSTNQAAGDSSAFNRNSFSDTISTLDGYINILIEKATFLGNGRESGRLLAERAKEIIKYELHNANLSITLLSDKMNITAPYLCYLFKQQYKDTINHFINRKRIEKAKNLLSLSQLKVYEIAKQCGFSSTNYFTRAFKKLTGILPTQYRWKTKI